MNSPSVTSSAGATLMAVLFASVVMQVLAASLFQDCVSTTCVSAAWPQSISGIQPTELARSDETILLQVSNVLRVGTDRHASLSNEDPVTDHTGELASVEVVDSQKQKEVDSNKQNDLMSELSRAAGAIVATLSSATAKINTLKSDILNLSGAMGGHLSGKMEPLEATVSHDCPCLKAKPTSLKPNSNITAELPDGIEMKHAGWTDGLYNKGIGVFASRAFAKGEELGSAKAQVLPCEDSHVHTPLGEWAVDCLIHFYPMPDCSGNTTLGQVGVFASWMSFLNGNGVDAPDEAEAEAEAEADVDVDMLTVSSSKTADGDGLDPSASEFPDANVVFGENTCRGGNPEATEYHLLASKDIAMGEEILLNYNWKSSGQPMPMPAPMPMPMPAPMPMPMPNPMIMPMPNEMPMPAPMPMPNEMPMPAPMPMIMPAPMPMPNEMPMPAPMPMPNDMPMPAPMPMPNEMPMPAPMPMPNEMPMPNPMPMR